MYTGLYCGTLKDGYGIREIYRVKSLPTFTNGGYNDFHADKDHAEIYLDKIPYDETYKDIKYQVLAWIYLDDGTKKISVFVSRNQSPDYARKDEIQYAPNIKFSISG